MTIRKITHLKSNQTELLLSTIDKLNEVVAELNKINSQLKNVDKEYKSSFVGLYNSL